MIDTKSIKQLVNNEMGLYDRRIYTDPDIYQQELEQIWGRCWVGIGHESQISKPNDFVANYIGEDPVLVTRDAKGKIHAFLNMCRHRGNRVCRADEGNAPSFMCTYHGWTFATDGKLVGVPGFKEAYFEELDRSQWGLVEARVDTYKGLIFATWDNGAPSLPDYLGDITWYMDLCLDRREGGTELLPGIEKRVMATNWKIPVDNHSDGYHFAVTHGSAVMVLGRDRSPTGQSEIRADPTTARALVGNGHSSGAYIGKMERSRPFSASSTDVSAQIIRDYYTEHLPELRKRLGENQARQASMGIGNVFPATNWNGSTSQIRLRHPRGPEKTEIWTYLIVDKKAPPEVRQAFRRNHVLCMGPAGTVEQDDVNNWYQVTASGKLLTGSQYPMNFQLGLNREKRTSELAPGRLSVGTTEDGQRDFYGRWAEIMDAPSWDQISIDPITYGKLGKQG